MLARNWSELYVTYGGQTLLMGDGRCLRRWRRLLSRLDTPHPAHIERIHSLVNVLKSGPTKSQGVRVGYCAATIGNCEFPVGEVENKAKSVLCGFLCFIRHNAM